MDRLNRCLVLPALMLALVALTASCAKEEKGVDPNAPIKCASKEFCPPTLPLCVGGECKAAVAEENELDTADLDPDLSNDREETVEQDEAPVFCPEGIPCCDDLSCVPPTWKQGDPEWFCDNKGTAESRCREKFVCPAQFECCSSVDCIEGKDGQGYVGNPGKCDTFYCKVEGNNVGGTCQNRRICEPGEKKCSTPNEADPSSFARYQSCEEYPGATGSTMCLRWKFESCDPLLDCEAGEAPGTVDCIRSGRCNNDTDCIENFVCKETPQGKKCVLKTVGLCEPCIVNQNGQQVVVAECDPQSPDAPLLCCTDQQTGNGVCDKSTPDAQGQPQCAGACQPQQ